MGPSTIEPQGRGAEPATVGLRAPLERVARPLGVALETLGVQLRAGEQFSPTEVRSIVSLVQTTLDVFGAPASSEPAGHADPAASRSDALLREAVVVVRALQGDLTHVFSQQQQMTDTLAPLLRQLQLLMTPGDPPLAGRTDPGSDLVPPSADELPAASMAPGDLPAAAGGSLGASLTMAGGADGSAGAGVAGGSVGAGGAGGSVGAGGAGGSAGAGGAGGSADAGLTVAGGAGGSAGAGLTMASGAGGSAGAGLTMASGAGGSVATGVAGGSVGAGGASGFGGAGGAVGPGVAAAYAGGVAVAYAGGGEGLRSGDLDGGASGRSAGPPGRVGASSPALLARLVAGLTDAMESLGGQGIAGAAPLASLASVVASLAEAIASLEATLLAQALDGTDLPSAARFIPPGGATGDPATTAAATRDGQTGGAASGVAAAKVNGGGSSSPTAGSGPGGVATADPGPGSPVEGNTACPPAAVGSATAGGASRLPATEVMSRLLRALSLVIGRLQAALPPGVTPRALALALAEATALVEEPKALNATAAQQCEPRGAAEPRTPRASGGTMAPAQPRPGGTQASRPSPPASGAAQSAAAAGAGQGAAAGAGKGATGLATTIARLIAGIEQLLPGPASAPGQTPAGAMAAALQAMARGASARGMAGAVADSGTTLATALATIKSQLQAMLSVALLEATADDAALPGQNDALERSFALLAAVNATLAEAAPLQTERFDPYRWGLVAALNYRAERRRPRDRATDPEHCALCGRLLVRTLGGALVCPTC